MNTTAFDLLRDPRKNKGTGFTREERDRYGLNGLLPDTVESIITQVQRAHEQVSHLEKPINQYTYRLQLLDNNERLFFKLLMDDPAKYMPLVYTPTVGEACQTFGHIFRRPRGIYISIKDKDRIKSILQSWPEKDVRFTVVLRIMQEGKTEEEACRQFYMFDIDGLLVNSRTDLADYQEKYGHNTEACNVFADAVLKIKPTAIIGVSTIGGAFNQKVIERMAAINERPIIFPYSNPTSHAECTAEQAYTWSKGKAIFASGSPFGLVEYHGKNFIPGQGNNVYIFPAMGLAVFATEAKRLSDELFITAAVALAEQVTDEDFGRGLIYPSVDKILHVSLQIAIAVAAKIFELGLAGIDEPENIASFVKSKMYRPIYS